MIKTGLVNSGASLHVSFSVLFAVVEVLPGETSQDIDSGGPCLQGINLCMSGHAWGSGGTESPACHPPEQLLRCLPGVCLAWWQCPHLTLACRFGWLHSLVSLRSLSLCPGLVESRRFARFCCLPLAAFLAPSLSATESLLHYRPTMLLVQF